MLDTVAENAARVCGATDAVIFRIDGNASTGPPIMGRFSGQAVKRVQLSAVDRSLVALLSTDGRFTYTIWRQSLEPNFLKV